MCGIAGSSNFNKAFEFYKTNLPRGYYSSGGIVVRGNTWNTYKTLGLYEKPFGEPNQDFYLYHSRGPTTETKEYNPINNHPFFYGDWIVAHNGIISNFEDLGKKYFPEEDFTIKTDSCIVPRMLSIKPMKEALEELKGTFALWMWNRSSGALYICRSANTLFANFINGDFCSTQFEKSEPLEEGFIYTVNNKIVKEEKFISNSPYFVF